MISSMTRISVTSLRGNYESSTTSHCHKKIMNKDFGLLFFKLGQVFVQDFSKITSGLNMNIYFWPIILSLPTVLTGFTVQSSGQMESSH